MQICTLLEQDPLLVQADGRYKGKLAFPYGYGLVLTHITRQQFNTANLGAVLNENLVICQDEMLETADNFVFQEQL